MPTTSTLVYRVSSYHPALSFRNTINTVQVVRKERGYMYHYMTDLHDDLVQCTERA